MKIPALVLAALLAIAGCATAPVPASSAQPVPAGRLLSGYSAVATPSPEAVQVTVVRDSGMLGAGVPAKLSIDGTDIAMVRIRERLEIYLKPGSYIFGVVPSPQMAGALVEESFTISADKHHFFRISVTAGGSFAVQASTQLD